MKELGISKWKFPVPSAYEQFPTVVIVPEPCSRGRSGISLIRMGLLRHIHDLSEPGRITRNRGELSRTGNFCRLSKKVLSIHT